MEVDQKNEPMEDDQSDVENEKEDDLKDDKDLKEEEDDDKEELMEAQEYKELVAFGIDEAVALQMMRMFTGGHFLYEDLDERAKNALKEFPAKDAIRLMKVLQKTTIENVMNKSAYLCGQMRMFRLNRKAFMSKMTDYNPPGPDEDKLKDILNESGYTLDITPGQRRYGGPPPDWEGPEPQGCELCVGRIPKMWFEDKLVPLLSDIGRIYELRIMIDSHTGYNRNFCFVRYCGRDDAEKAMRILNKYEVRKGKTLKANLSASNTRLFVGNIPKPKDMEEIMEEFSKSIEGITEVIISVNDEMAAQGYHNKGYAFLEFGDHKTAATAKKKLENTKETYFTNRVVVEWAEIIEEPSDDQMSDVKIVHVKNLSSDVNEDLLRKTFEAHGKIHNVQKVRDYAFIHFDKREDALAAIEALNGTELGKTAITVDLSKSSVVKNRRRDNQKRMGIMQYRHNTMDRGDRNRGGRGNRGRGGNRGGGRGSGGGGGRGGNKGGNWGNKGMGGMNMGMMQNRNMGWGGNMGFGGGYSNNFGYGGNRMGGGMGGYGMGGMGMGMGGMGMGMGGMGMGAMGMGGMGMGAMGMGGMGMMGGMGGFGGGRMGGGMMNMNQKRKMGGAGDLGNKKRR